MKFLIAAFLVQVSPVTAVPQMPPPLLLDTSEVCEGSAGRIDMARVMFLENRTLNIDGATGPLQLRLEGETFHSEELGERSRHRAYSNWIGTMVQPGADLDIDLKLALLNGRLLLYWRETYQHRFWRYGLITLEGRALFGDDAVAMHPLCEGRGGSQSDG
jgi:hypothetical protein